MENRKVEAIAEIAVALLVIGACVALYFDSLSIRASRFDSLGSAAAPRALIFLLILLSLPIGWRGFRGFKTRPDRAEAPAPDGPRPRPELVLVTLLLTMAYVGLLATRMIDFGLLTAAFVVVSGFFLVPRTPAMLAILVALALTLGFGGGYLLKSVFYISLP